MKGMFDLVDLLGIKCERWAQTANTVFVSLDVGSLLQSLFFRVCFKGIPPLPNPLSPAVIEVCELEP